MVLWASFCFKRMQCTIHYYEQKLYPRSGEVECCLSYFHFYCVELFSREIYCSRCCARVLGCPLHWSVAGPGDPTEDCSLFISPASRHVATPHVSPTLQNCFQSSAVSANLTIQSCNHSGQLRSDLPKLGWWRMQKRLTVLQGDLLPGWIGWAGLGASRSCTPATRPSCRGGPGTRWSEGRAGR